MKAFGVLAGGVRRRWRKVPVGLGQAAIWLAAAAVWRRPELSLGLASWSWLSAALLAVGRPRQERLLKTALVFWGFWTFLGLVLRSRGLSEGREPAQLAAWLALGLHLTLVWTPLELGRAWGRVVGAALGPRRGRLCAAAALVMLKQLPAVLEDARQLRRTLSLRAAGLPWRRRLVFFGRGLARLSLARVDDLTRALLVR
ncbi:MAG: hypothetical protein LBU12_04945 [Deltaproteobacteria bacterium]|jgi:hypothetical protein|nr:hypothetical protein [Deltaproteobacteria bacterium]